MTVHTFNPSPLEAEVDLCTFEAVLIYVVSPKPVQDFIVRPCLIKQNTLNPFKQHLPLI